MTNAKRRVKKFRTGMTVVTASVDALVKAGTISADDIDACLARHSLGDWGDVSENDAALNDEAIRDGEGAHSVYEVRRGDAVTRLEAGESPKVTLWVITDADRAHTTVLLPEDY